ncbi:aminoglycoside N(3)-acetyltransferase [Leekyejoonella antrihumi]|uniref:Aminoglycoside N(3)-acetyltransferase n=1 Tax=Leekyejoonella antrihumi TaxID=1660198 RepID=A0A563E7Y3_9MICO|nr:AAC(3) family N-acetyltransferase [Leekyejoonella antrihumi]TWP38312.1 AAC(3) family N-acetyltransferase [Leekyejoonella antrihumi]
MAGHLQPGVIGSGDGPQWEHDSLLSQWREAGVEPGMNVIVHSALSSIGRVQGGAETVVRSLRTAVGPDGTLVAPAFTPQVTDPHPSIRAVPEEKVRTLREQVPLFTPGLPSPMGAVAEAIRLTPGSVRSRHPQASVAALGARAGDIVAGQPLNFALGRRSPFDRLLQLGGWILLVGVGHNRNSFLHHAESLIERPRLKLRRFPVMVDGERIWWETLDVGDDNDTHFPVVGRDYERHAGIHPVQVGGARTVLLPAKDLVSFAGHRLAELIDHDL